MIKWFKQKIRKVLDIDKLENRCDSLSMESIKLHDRINMLSERLDKVEK